MPSPLRVTLSADPVEGRVLPSAVFARPPHALDARAAEPVSARSQSNDSDRRDRSGSDRSEDRGSGRIDIRGANRSDGRRDLDDRRGSDDRPDSAITFPTAVVVRHAALNQSDYIVRSFLPIVPLPRLLFGDSLPTATRTPVAQPSAVLADTPSESAGQPATPAAVEGAAAPSASVADRTPSVAPSNQAPTIPARTAGEAVTVSNGVVASASPVANGGTPASAPPAGVAPVADQPVTPIVTPPALPEVAPPPTNIVNVPALVAEAAAVFPALSPLVGVLPADAEAIEQAAAAVVSHVAALADAVPAVVAGPEGYAWVTAGVCLAGGLAFAARGQRRPRRSADPVTLGTDSVFALEARRDSDVLGR